MKCSVETPTTTSDKEELNGNFHSTSISLNKKFDFSTYFYQKASFSQIIKELNLKTKCNELLDKKMKCLNDK